MKSLDYDFAQNARKRRSLFKRTTSSRSRRGKILALVFMTAMYGYYFSNEETKEIGRFLQNEDRGQGENLDEANSHGSDDKGKKKGYSHSPYVLIGDIIQTMPPNIPQSKRLVPSYIQLCKAFLERSELTGFSSEGNYAQSRAAINSNGEDENAGSGKVVTEEARLLEQGDEGGDIEGDQGRVVDEGNLFPNQSDEGASNFRGTFRIVEDEALCEDWVAPHYGLLSIYASSLIAAVGKPLGLRYKHDCRKHIMKMHNDPNKHYDYTPVQTLLPDNLISKIDAQKIGSEQIKTMCQRCISDFESDVGLPEFMSSTTHQCIMMPDSDMAESLLANGNELPMTYILPSIIDRMRHIADDWIVTTSHIKDEDETGAIIALDGRSTMMNYSVYDKVIPSGVTSIQIFASSSCGLDYVDTSKTTDCIEHGRRLKRYFKQTRPGTYVRYDVVGSTAASYTRMINARILVCPPGTIMCLLPALSKKAGKKAYIAEDPSEVETFQWFENHVLAERKALGFQEKGFDDVDESDYLTIISDVSLDMPLDAIGESGSDASNTTDTGLDNPTDSQMRG